MLDSNTAFRKLLGADRETSKAVEKIKAGLGRRTLGDVYGPFENLPGMRGLWTAASVDSSGIMYDRSTQGRSLLYNGNPTISIYNNLIPYWSYDGTGDFHSRNTDSGTEITGLETTIAAAYRGLTFGGWFWLDAQLGGGTPLISKFLTTGNQRSYMLYSVTGSFPGRLTMLVSADGTVTTTVTSPANNTFAQGEWFFAVGRFTPSTELACFLNGVKTINTTSIPASIFASTAGFNQFGFNTGSVVSNGHCALTFLCAAALPDELINHLLVSSRVVFDV